MLPQYMSLWRRPNSFCRLKATKIIEKDITPLFGTPKKYCQ